MNKDQVYLIDPLVLKYIGSLIKNKGKILEVGSGKGNITRFIPYPRLLVEKREKYKTYNQQLLIKDVLGLKFPLEIETMVSNLPFDLSVAILLHLRKNSFIKNYYVIIQKEVYLNIKNKKSKLYYTMNHLFEVIKLLDIPSKSFYPVPKIEGVLLHLKPLWKDWGYVDFLKKINCPRKKIKKSVLWDGEQRLGDLSPEQMYKKWKCNLICSS